MEGELHRLAGEHGIAIRVSHFPPGTSKSNKVEHRLSRSSASTGAPGRSGPTRPSSTRSATRRTEEGSSASRVRSARYSVGQRVSEREMRSLNLESDVFRRLALHRSPAQRCRVTETVVHTQALVNPSRRSSWPVHGASRPHVNWRPSRRCRRLTPRVRRWSTSDRLYEPLVR
ncbi:ISAzo13-like element transposase-related protein [Sandaracinus amylolyticus]|uniref:ISAzo13-like element transposase-related protein n=1 Tax=Sandaracinus amylolyticus TaxID=927083 RepID=UPI0009467574